MSMRSFNLRGGTAVALALVVALATLCVGVATADAAPKLRSIRCASSGCHAVAPKKEVIMKGKGFTKGMQAVFTKAKACTKESQAACRARRDGFTFQEPASTRVASGSRIRARVPSDAI